MLKWLLSLFGVKTPVDTTDLVLSQKKDQLDTLKELTATAVAPKVHQNTPVQNKKADPVKTAPKAPPKVAKFKTESSTKAWVDDTPAYVAPVHVPTPTYDTTDYSSRCSDSYSSSSYSSSDSGSSCSSSSFD